jgi:hypothetical protein
MRRWFQFSLRSLFLLMLIVAVYCAGWKSASLKHEKELNEALNQAAKEAEELRAAHAAAQTTQILITGSGMMPPYITGPLTVSGPNAPIQTTIQWNSGTYPIDLGNSGIVLQPMPLTVTGSTLTVPYNPSPATLSPMP